MTVIRGFATLDLVTEYEKGFRAAFASRMVVAPGGGSSGPIEIQVVAKCGGMPA